MQGVAVLLTAAQGLIMRRVILLRRCGFHRAAKRLYAQWALTLSLMTWAAMLVQEMLLLKAGLLSWQSGLPLHLCSAMGLLTPPMLLTGRRPLWHITLYLGLPAGLLATFFPSVITTPWPYLTRLSFHLLHGCVFLAPLLPLCLGVEPSPGGVLPAGVFLAGLTLLAAGVNRLTGANYLFLNLPAPGTPLAALAKDGVHTYRAWLVGIAVAVLATEAGLVAQLTHPHG